MTYRKDIDFLRALAAIGIFLYHLSLPGLSGGYIFVDIFFVITGFLISTIIITQIQSNQFSIKQFYINRFYRLFPSLIVTIIGVLIAGYFILTPTHFKNLAGSSIASTFSVSNIYFWGEVDYFDIDKYLKPLLHTWSLGVEEQFYLIWPALLVLTLGLRSTVKSYYAALALLFCISLGLSVYWSHNETMAAGAYYLLPSRIFEFIMGASIASFGSFANIKNRMSPAFANVIFSLGLGLILLSAFTFSETDAFPGYLAVIPCLGAVLCLVGGAKSRLASGLSNPVSTFLGQIGYATYLVHWPLITFYMYGRSDVLSSTEKGGIFITGLILASALHIFVEQPFRQKPGPVKLFKNWSVSRARGGLLCLGLMCMTTMGALIAYATNGIQSRLNTDMQAVYTFVEAEYQNRQSVIRAPDCHYNVPSETIEDYLSRFETCNPPSKLEGDAPNILLIGDSHGADIYASFSYARPDVNIIQLTKAGCYVDTDLNMPGNNCAAMHRFARQYLKTNALKIDGVIFKIRGEILYEKEGEAFKELRPFLIAPAKAYLESLQSEGVPVVWLGPNVEYTTDFRQIVERSESLAQALETAAADRRWEELDSLDAELTSLFKDSPVSYIASRQLCGGPCPLTADDGTPITPDYGHWGRTGSQFMSRYILEAADIKHMIE